MNKSKAKTKARRGGREGKVSDADVRRIRKLRKDGDTYRKIASVTGHSVGHVFNIVRGKVYAHVK